MNNRKFIRGRLATRALLAFGILSLLVLAGCGQTGSTPSAATTTAYGSAGAPKAQLFSVPRDQLSNLQIVSAQEETILHVLHLPGSVTYNAYETTPVIPQVSGPVTHILVDAGQFVRAGQPMLDVSSADFAQLRSNYLKSSDAYSLSVSNYQRAKDLYAHHAIAQADLLQAQSTRNQALADLQAAEQSLRVLGIADPARVANGPATQVAPVLAPISGEVVQRMASPGEVVQAGSTQVFTISNTSTVWVLVDVYQKDLAAIHLGEPVTVTTDAYSRAFRGRISYIAPALDPVTRTLQVRIVTSNPGGMLKKDMYVTATLEAGKITGLTVPNAAILRNSENEPFVYIARGKDQFAERLVTLSESQGGQTQILGGLREGEKVVGNGSLFLQFAISRER